MKTTLYLIRHSEKLNVHVSCPHAQFDRIQPLSVVGEERAAKLLNVPELRHADAAYASPFARTISTLRYLFEADAVPLELDERLRELEFGGNRDLPRPKPGEGPGGKPGPGGPPRMDPNDIRVRQWLDLDLADVGGESVRQCRARMTEAIREIAEANPGKTVLIGSHGAAIAAYLGGVINGVDDDFVRTITQPDVFRLDWEDGKVQAVTRVPCL